MTKLNVKKTFRNTTELERTISAFNDEIDRRFVIDKSTATISIEQLPNYDILILAHIITVMTHVSEMLELGAYLEFIHLIL